MKTLLNSKGMGVLPLVAGISVTAMVAVGMISQMGLDSLTRSARAYSEWETNLSNQMALSLGGYFVAHNLVVCREGGWADVDKTVKCRWGGKFHVPEILPSKYNVKSVAYEDGALVLSVRNEEGKTPVTTKLRMDLVDWSKDPTFRSMVGQIPPSAAMVDDDHFVVLMSASTEMEVGDDKTKTVTKTGALRRPIGSPSIQVRMNTGRESCIFECEAGTVLTRNPECRGPLGAPSGEASATFGVRVTNMGPGAVYRLKYERTTHFNQDTYPGKADEKTLIDVLAAQEVFMPGEKIDKEIERKCYPPVRTFMTVQRTQTVDGGFGDEGGTSTSTNVTVASSFRSLSSESFNISTSRFDPVQATQPNFFETYDPYNPSTYTRNPSPSEIEPKRLGSRLPAFDVVSPQETITETTTETRVVVRPRASSFDNRDGDGDGDN